MKVPHDYGRSQDRLLTIEELREQRLFYAHLLRGANPFDHERLKRALCDLDTLITEREGEAA